MSAPESETERYADIHRRSLEEPETFWLEQARAIDWDVEPAVALDRSATPLPRWFPDGRLNTCHNALDRHVRAGHGQRTALIHDSAVTGETTRYSYAELLAEVSRFAGVLAGAGVGPGDRVVIYLPMIPEAVIAMLATARLGAIHSVVFGGFAARELAVRIDDAEPTVLVTASGSREPSREVPYLPLVRRALAQAAHYVPAVVVKSRSTVVHGSAAEEAITDPSRTWLDWDAAMRSATDREAVPVAATDPLYILYTSGTTGRPKGVVRDNGGHAVALSWSMRHVYGLRAGEVMFTASDVGWVVGHSYIVYGPLLAGATTVLYEGKPVGTPDAAAFWRIVREHGASIMFTAPTALRAIRRVDPDLRLLHHDDLASLRALFVAGERLDPETHTWATVGLAVPVIDHWWQTETGWPVCANPLGLEALPLKAGSPSVPMPGYDVRVVDVAGEGVRPGTEGAIVISLPLPPGTLQTLWRDDDRLVAGYLAPHPGFYTTGDSGYIDHDGYVFVMGRTDDVINVAGHRLSTGTMEQVLSGHPAVAECSVVARRDELKGHVPAGYVVLTDDARDAEGRPVDHEELVADLVELVRDQIGAVAAFREVTVVDALPKTRSGKLLRATIRRIADGQSYEVPATIEDPEVLESFAARVGELRRER